MVCTAADVLLKSESCSDLPKTTLTSDQRSCFSSLVAFLRMLFWGSIYFWLIFSNNISVNHTCYLFINGISGCKGILGFFRWVLTALKGVQPQISKIFPFLNMAQVPKYWTFYQLPVKHFFSKSFILIYVCSRICAR